MAKAAAPPADTALAIPPGQAGRLFAWFAAGIVAMLALLMLLPNSDYYRWQQGDGTILARARWIYERIHFDPTPIDVAMIGSSRMEASVRAPELSEILSARLGRPIRVVNFGLPQEGRNLHWAVVKQLLENRPEVRLIVLSAGRETVISHPGFRFLGDDASLLESPMIYNDAYAEDLFTLPYRHLAYFIQGLWPSAFQLSPRFDPAIYRERGFDPTQTFILDGKVVDREQQLDPNRAMQERAAINGVQWVDPKLRNAPFDWRYPIERHFTRRIASLAAQKHVQVAFLWVPTAVDPQEALVDPGFYAAIGPVWKASQLGDDPYDYMDSGHLNRQGTAKLLPWLADRLTALLAAPEKR